MWSGISLACRRRVLGWKAVVWIRDTRVADADFVTAAQRWVAEGAEVEHGIRVVVVSEVDDRVGGVGWWVDNELAGYGDAVGRALRAHDASTFPAMVFAEQEGELPVAHRTVCDVRVGLPWRQHQIALTSAGRGRGRGIGGRGWQRSLTVGRGRGRGRRVYHNGVCTGARLGAGVGPHARGAAHGRLGRCETPLAVGAAARGRRVGGRGRARRQSERRGRRWSVEVGSGPRLGRLRAHASLAQEVDPRFSPVRVLRLSEQV